MFRTRDFILFSVTIVFLLIAIGVTVFSKFTSAPTKNIDDVFVSSETVTKEYVATVYAPETLSREERLAALRQKIAADGSLTIAAPEIVEEVAKEDELESEDGGVSPSKMCAQPTTYRGNWPSGVLLELREGARMVYTESTSLKPAVGTATPEMVTEQTVLAQLPVPFGIAANPTCPTSDVVGIAQDGSLIKNAETGLYSVFGENTLIGYALDGFPIYGVSSMATDECGGAVVGGTYRYYLHDDRGVIVNCFSGIPVRI